MVGVSGNMASFDVLRDRFESYVKMYTQNLREITFEDWPFREECNCTPEKVSSHRAELTGRCLHVPLRVSDASDEFTLYYTVLNHSTRPKGLSTLLYAAVSTSRVFDQLL